MLVLTSLWTRAGATSIRPCSLNINRSTGMERHSGVIILNAPYHILHTLYAFNNCRSTRQLLFKTIQNENFRFFSFRLKRNKQRNETTRREKEAGVAERATRDKIARLVTFVSTTRDRALSWRKSPPLCSLLPVHATSSLEIFPVNRFLKYKRSLPWKKKGKMSRD